MVTVGLEGTILAGKTTVAHTLRSRLGEGIIVIEEYVEYAGSAKNFPKFPPADYGDALEATKFFIELERRRANDWKKMSRWAEIVAVDRTFLSCLGFDYATRFLNRSCDIFEESYRLWSESTKIVPDLLVTLEISDDELGRRMAAQQYKYPSPFPDRSFNKHLRNFLLSATIEARRLRVNAMRPIETVVSEVLKAIRTHGG